MRDTAGRDVLFIDGASFIKTMDKYGALIFGDEKPHIDWMSVCEGHDRIFFYDALPSKLSKESKVQFEAKLEERIALHDKLSKIDNFHVREGLTRARRGKTLQQKGVDILLALEVYTQAVSGNMARASFILTDMDFYPMFDKLLETRCNTTLYFDPASTSEDLISCADRSVALTGEHLYRWFKNKEVISSQDYRLEERWANRSLEDECALLDKVDIADFEFTIRFHQEQERYLVRGTGSRHIYLSKSLYLACEGCQGMSGLRLGTLYAKCCKLPPIADRDSLSDHI